MSVALRQTGGRHQSREEQQINATEQKKLLQTQLWGVANELRGNMGADEFRDYILGFIFYKYLSERFVVEADAVLTPDR